jgi:hypothetical protein
VNSSTKKCPQCQSLLVADAAACVCGYHFEAAPEAEFTSSDLVTQAELLYETHLRARHQRALRAVKLAKIDLLRDPGDAAKKKILLEAEKEARTIAVQTELQSARVADARAAASARRSEAPSTVVEAPAVFRESQTIRSETAISMLRLAAATEARRAHQASAVFHAAQADRAEVAAATVATPDACPGCGAAVAVGAARCECGFQLLASNDPGDFLSAEELAALRGPI